MLHRYIVAAGLLIAAATSATPCLAQSPVPKPAKPPPAKRQGPSADVRSAHACFIWAGTLTVAATTIADDAKRATASQDLSDTYNASVAPRYSLCVERYNEACADRWGKATRDKAEALGLPAPPAPPPPNPFSTPALIDSIPQCSR